MKENTIRIKFEVENEYGEVTALEKIVPIDYLGNTELGTFNECYRQFLQACTFSIDEDECVAVIPKTVGWEHDWYSGEF